MVYSVNITENAEGGYTLRIPTPRGHVEITTDTMARACDEYADWCILAGVETQA